MCHRALTLLLLVSAAWAGEDQLREEVKDLRKRLAQREAQDLSKAVDSYLATTATGATTSRQPKLIEISADLLVGAGSSTARGGELLQLQDGGHDPRRRGFTIQQLEVSLIGNVDPYFRAEAHILLVIDPIAGETTIELEEAFLQTLQLPGNLLVEVGHFFTEFGRHNPQHPHQWQFVDSPIVLARFFGPDGQRAPGFRIAWLAPTDTFLQIHFGMQNAEGETMVSFFGNEEVGEERAVAGRPFVKGEVRSPRDFVYLLRIETSFEIGDSWTALIGGSGLVGPNATGEGAVTTIYGIDIHFKWRPAAHDQGWPFLVIQTEVIARRYEAVAFDDGVDVFAAETFDDWGFYAQILWGIRRPWTVGTRVGFASGDGPEASGDPLRDDRLRVSVMAAYHFSEFSRLRLQANYERADFLPDRDHFSLWLVFEIGIGAHPAHVY